MADLSKWERGSLYIVDSQQMGVFFRICADHKVSATFLPFLRKLTVPVNFWMRGVCCYFLLEVVYHSSRTLDSSFPKMILVFLWCVGWLLPFFLTVVLSSWSSHSFFQLVCPMTIINSSGCNVFLYDLFLFWFSFLFFILFGCVDVVPVNVYSASYGVSGNASSEIININLMMAVESSFCIQWVGSCSQYRYLLLSVFLFQLLFW